MGAVFIKILNMSLTAGFLVLAVLLVRLLFKKKAPKALFPVLWAMVAVRLVCPVTFETGFSLIRNAEPVEQAKLPEKFLQKETVHTPSEKEPLPEGVEPVEIPEKLPPGVEVVIIDTPEIGEGFTNVFEGLGETENPGPDAIGSADDSGSQGATGKADSTIKETPFSVIYTEHGEDGTEFIMKRTDLSAVLAVIWLCGIGCMILYTAISYLRIYRQVRESAPLSKNVRVCDRIDSPFILGIVRPKIYLPSDINVADREFVLAHERAHLKRFDHIWKPLGFLLLSVYWFHPLLWVAYILLCKDIEYACDERVIKELGAEQKKNYSTALINCSVSRKMISACPLAFGETGVKGRVKSVLNYKKPAFWIIVASALLCVVMVVCFLTNPKGEKVLPKAGDIITFGTYEQDNVTENGAEPIEWIVVDVFDGKATLLSKYGLDAKAYHEDRESDATWNSCTLRDWLNGEFYENAFNEEEREQVLITRNENLRSSEYKYFTGPATEDKVYLLSIDELMQVFESEVKKSGNPEEAYVSKASITTATAYAKAQGAWEGMSEDGPACAWLLRNMGESMGSATRVTIHGELSHNVELYYASMAIRPAVRIDLSEGNYAIVETETDPEAEVAEENTAEEKTHTRVARWTDIVPLSEAKPGYVVEFGSYEQNNDDCDGSEAIEWLVLKVKDGKALLLSKYALDSKPYHERQEKVTWETCSLREWLNGEFYEWAFGKEEKKRIASTLLENVRNPWNSGAEYEYTEDNVFLPSLEDVLYGTYDFNGRFPEYAYEFDGYFLTDAERVTRWTEYARRQFNSEANNQYADWWLRTSATLGELPSTGGEMTSFYKVPKINGYGKLDSTYGDVEYEMGVRPAIWVELDDLEEKENKDTTKKKVSFWKKGSFSIKNGLPERYSYKELKEAFIAYLNHEAYLNPSEYPQEKRNCTYDVYCTTESLLKRVYLKTETEGKETWYLCTPAVYLEEESPLCISLMDYESMKRLTEQGAVTYLGTDSVKIPAVTKPDYNTAEESDRTEFEESLKEIYDSLSRNGYLKKNGAVDSLKLEAWISDYDMEKQLFPKAYVLINDSYIFETDFTAYEGLFQKYLESNYFKDEALYQYLDYEFTSVPETFDGRNIRPVATVDTKHWERVKECAVFRYVIEEERTVTLLIDGNEVTVPRQNVTIQSNGEHYYTSVAFVPQETVANRTHYNIYRSVNDGKNWTLVAEDYVAPASKIDAVLVPMNDHFVCFFELDETTKQTQCIWSEDGGTTWSVQNYAIRPNTDLKRASVGSSVIFGNHEQNGDDSDGKEPLEWLVLDCVGDKVLLLSKYGIEDWVYDGKIFEAANWETSTIRHRLNSDFYQTAFSTEERAIITETRVETPDNTQTGVSGGNATRDYVFLLSANEVLYGTTQDGTPYFEDEESRITIPTAEAEGLFFSSWEQGNNEFDIWAGITTDWWLRTPGENEYRAAYVRKDGTISMTGEANYTDGIKVRPAIWVDVTKIPR